MTRSQAIRRHRILWRWMAKNPKAEKGEWPGWEWNGGKYQKVYADCFLCNVSRCNKCAVIWPPNDEFCCDSLLGEWADAGYKKNWRKRAVLAKQIAELPVRRL